VTDNEPRQTREPRNFYETYSGHPPVEIEEIMQMVAVIPNDDVPYAEWVKFGMSVFDGSSQEGFTPFDTWSQKSSKYNAANTIKKWKEFHKSPPTQITIATLIDLANKADPNWRNTSGKKETAVKDKFLLTAVPYTFPDPKTIEQWDWQYGRVLLRKKVTVTVATGGTGKSSLSNVEALALTSGRALLNIQVLRPLRVLLVNLEDNRNDMDKRIAGAMRRYGLTPADIGGRLFIIAKGEMKLRMAWRGQYGIVKCNSEAIAEFIRYIQANKIDVVSIDPFVKTHAVSENISEDITQVMDSYDEIAEGGDCSISLWHHTRKSRGESITVESSRGGIGITDAARVARMMETMTEGEGNDLGIDNRKRYFRTFDGKTNFAPSTDKSEWDKLISVPVGNGLSDLKPSEDSNYFMTADDGDEVGVPEHWTHPGRSGKAVPAEAITEIQRQVGNAPQWKLDTRADMYVGQVVARVLKLDDPKSAECKAALQWLLKAGKLEAMEAHDPAKREKKMYVIATKG
jgi:hypothetical protein